MKLKKMISIFLACVLALSILSACSDKGTPGSNSTPPSDPSSNEGASSPERPEPYRLGAVALGGDTFGAATKSVQSMCDSAGVEFFTAELAGYDDQGFLTTYENLINMGADGVIVYAFSEGTIRLLADLCEQNNVDWFMANRKIASDDLKSHISSNSRYVGNCFCEEEENAYNMVKRLHDDHGVTDLAVIGLTQGDANGDLRDKGIARACEELNINLLTETRGISDVADITNAVEGIITSYPEVNGIFIVGGAVTRGALAGANQALANHNMQAKVAIGMIDIAAGMDEYMGEGKPLRIVTGGNLVMDYVLAAASMINHSNGINTDKEPYILNTNMLVICTPEDAMDYATYYENPNQAILPSDRWTETLLGQDTDSMQAFVDSFTVEYAKSLNQ